ncbi:MAG: hypothetical protein ACTSXT_13690 [Candidatus Helarchaeota archaeon]
MKQFVSKYHYFSESSNLNKIINEKWFVLRKYKGRQAVWDGGVSRGIRLKDITYSDPSDPMMETATGLWSIGRKGYPHVIKAPYNWLNELPMNVPLCGELWLNDDEFKLSSIVSEKKNISIREWNKVKYMIFNIKPYELWQYTPPIKTIFNYNILIYKNIYSYLQQYKNDIIKPIKKTIIKNQRYWNYLKTIAEKNNYEGYVFINPNMLYEVGITNNILKWKRDFEIEVIIEGYNKGEKTEIGSIKCSCQWGENLKTIVGGESIPPNLFHKLIQGQKVYFKISGGLKKEDRFLNKIKNIYPIGKEFLIKFNGVTNTGKPQHVRFI